MPASSGPTAPTPTGTLGSGPPGMTAPFAPPTPPPPPPRKKPLVLVAVIAVAVVVVLAVVVFAGVFNSSGGSGTTTAAGPIDYSSALPLASAAAQNTSGGPWTIIAAEGVAVPSTVSQANVGSIGGNGGCTFTPEPGGATEVSIPGTPAGSTPGKVSVWMFFAKNPAGNSILLIAVDNGHATPLVLVTGCATVSTFASFGSIVGADVLNSTTIATAFNAAGGSSFLANGTWQIQLFILLGPSADTGNVPVWDVMYSTCAILATSGPGSWLSGYYYAQSGTAVEPPAAGSGTCS